LMKMNQNLDPVNVAFNIYKFVNENDRMRILRVTFQPGDVAKMHNHPQHMAYVMRGGRVKMASETNTQEMDLKEGTAIFLDAQNHETTNIGNTVIDLLVVELKD
jgi:quercetin dioxygenase-like cupin family protein